MESQVALQSKTQNVCMRSLTARLSNPRTTDPSVAPPSGEGVFLDALARHPKRPPNLEHLTRLARPNRRGGTALAWRCPAPTDDRAGDQALMDDHTGTPQSMRTTSPPGLQFG